MPPKCVIKSCPNSERTKRDRPDLYFHRFTANAVRRENWIINIQVLANQIGKIPVRAVICSDHFADDAYVSDGLRRTLLGTAEPTLFGSDAESCSNNFMDVEKLSSSYSHMNDASFIESTTSNNDEPTPIRLIQNQSTSAPTENSKLENPSLEPIDEKPVIIPNNQEIVTPLPDSQPQPTAKPRIRIRNLHELIERPPDPLDDSPFVGLSSKECKQEPLLVPDKSDIENALPKAHIQPVVGPGSIIRVRYPGDINDVDKMSRMQLERCVRLFKEKVVNQAATIKALRRQVRTKDRQILRYRNEVRELKAVLR